MATSTEFFEAVAKVIVVFVASAHARSGGGRTVDIWHLMQFVCDIHISRLKQRQHCVVGTSRRELLKQSLNALAKLVVELRA